MSNKKSANNIKITNTGREYLDISGEKGVKLARQILNSGVFDKAPDIRQSKIRQNKK